MIESELWGDHSWSPSFPERQTTCLPFSLENAYREESAHPRFPPIFLIHPAVPARINEIRLNQPGGVMAKCDVCGNDYDKSFQVVSAGKTRTFDSFECAIHMLAPTCPHCNCRVIGHGVEAGGQIYCCVHCAEESGAHGLKDRN